MDNRRHGLIGLILRRPGLSLATAGSVLTVASVVNLAIVRFEDSSSRLFRSGLFGWSSFGLVPVAFFMLAGIVGLATGTGMLIAAAYVRGRPTRSRFVGCALVGVGMMTIAVGLYHQGAGWLPGILLTGIGAGLLKRPENHPTPSGSG